MSDNVSLIELLFWVWHTYDVVHAVDVSCSLWDIKTNNRKLIFLTEAAPFTRVWAISFSKPMSCNLTAARVNRHSGWTILIPGLCIVQFCHTSHGLFFLIGSRSIYRSFWFCTVQFDIMQTVFASVWWWCWRWRWRWRWCWWHFSRPVQSPS